MPKPPITFSADQAQHWRVPRGFHREDGPAEVYMPEDNWGLPSSRPSRQWMQVRWYQLNRLERCLEPRVHHPERLPMNL